MKNILLLTIPFLLFGCAHATIMPGEEYNRAVLDTSDDANAREVAVKDAQEYCEKKGKEAMFISDETKYHGDMDEKTRKTVKKASAAAMILGGAGSLNSSTHEGGNILGAAGTVGTVMTSGKDYKTEVKFKCK